MMQSRPILELIEETAAVLKKAVVYGIGEVAENSLLSQKLQESTYVFSGFKSFHEMKEAAGLLVDENGNRKPFKDYLNDVQKINSTYNKQYLSVEYDFTTASAQMAAKWDELTEDEERYYLQYRTMGDSKVRKAHAELNGITLPASDPFWNNYYPPNGFGCRCTVMKVRRAKYEASDSVQAVDLGNKATAGKYQEMFRFNPGKTQAAYPAYNSYTIKSCTTCSKGEIKLAKALKNELCSACRSIFEVKEWKSKSQQSVKEADKKVREWAAQFEEGRIFDSNKLHTTKLYISRGVAKRYLGHASSAEAKWILKAMSENPDNFTYKSYQALGAGKDMTDPKNLKNIDAKKKRRVTGYNYYEFEHMGKTWLIDMEVIGYNRREQPYSVRLKKRESE